ncbi:MAG: MFS transporter permease [Caulobacterales bacterium]|nr:MFS transporter permease [Caulobacterales bacterium]
MAIGPKLPRIPPVAAGAAAAVSGFASMFAWAACCVLPLALSVAGLSFAGAAVFAGARHAITLMAVAVLAGGWLLHWHRLRTCRADAACPRPSRLAVGLLATATVLVALSLAWGPFIEPWAMLRLAALR